MLFMVSVGRTCFGGTKGKAGDLAIMVGGDSKLLQRWFRFLNRWDVQLMLVPLDVANCPNSLTKSCGYYHRRCFEAFILAGAGGADRSKVRCFAGWFCF